MCERIYLKKPFLLLSYVSFKCWFSQILFAMTNIIKHERRPTRTRKVVCRHIKEKELLLHVVLHWITSNYRWKLFYLITNFCALHTFTQTRKNSFIILIPIWSYILSNPYKILRIIYIYIYQSTFSCICKENRVKVVKGQDIDKPVRSKVKDTFVTYPSWYVLEIQFPIIHVSGIPKCILRHHFQILNEQKICSQFTSMTYLYLNISNLLLNSYTKYSYIHKRSACQEITL